MSGYVIIIERADDDGGYGAWAPDLPGRVATGQDYDTCVAEMREAIRFHFDGMREDGDPIPVPTTRAVTISAA
ncbi:MAG: type II toxin-antitoxin system HicB family antitoxin [Pseudonocardiaceae bacterium]